jgi:hypothetical protein
MERSPSGQRTISKNYHKRRRVEGLVAQRTGPEERRGSARQGDAEQVK